MKARNKFFALLRIIFNSNHCVQYFIQTVLLNEFFERSTAPCIERAVPGSHLLIFCIMLERDRRSKLELWKEKQLCEDIECSGFIWISNWSSNGTSNLVFSIKFEEKDHIQLQEDTWQLWNTCQSKYKYHERGWTRALSKSKQSKTTRIWTMFVKRWVR